jgi:hypothetical protein
MSKGAEKAKGRTTGSTGWVIGINSSAERLLF